MPHLRSRARLVAVVAILALGGAGCLAAVPRTRPDPVLLYGDSLAWEARDYWTMQVASPGVAPSTRTFGGTALCDWLPTLADDVHRDPPDVVVLAFSGNNLTTCTRGAGGEPLTGDDLVARYEADLRTAIATAADSAVVVVGPPISRVPSATWPALSDMYRRVAAEHENVHYVDGGAGVTLDGAYADRLECLPHERPADGCTDGTIVVRSADGGHFCPTATVDQGGIVPECPVYSSGAWRYANTMSDAVRRVRAGLPT